MPTPKVPALSIISKIIGDSISIAIVSYAINMSIAKLFSKKHKYEIRPNQVNCLRLIFFNQLMAS